MIHAYTALWLCLLVLAMIDNDAKACLFGAVWLVIWVAGVWRFVL